jgi:hypothetical protein
MLTVLLAAAPALAFDVDLHVTPKEGASPWVTFHEVVPGVEQTVTVPCAQAPACRLSVVVTPDGDQFRVAVNVVEVRRGWLGAERTSLIGAPTFLVPGDQLAEFFIGDEVAVPGSNPVAWVEDGLHIQARVRVNEPA